MIRREEGGGENHAKTGGRKPVSIRTAKVLALSGTAALGVGMGMELASGSPNVLYNLVELILSPSVTMPSLGAAAVVVGADMLETALDIACGKYVLDRIRRWKAAGQNGSGAQ